MLFKGGSATSIQEISDHRNFQPSSLLKVIHESLIDRPILQVLIVIAEPDVDFVDLIVRIVVLSCHETLLEQVQGCLIILVRCHPLLRWPVYPCQTDLLGQVFSALLSPFDTDQKVVLTQHTMVKDHADIAISASLAHLFLWLARLDTFRGVLTAHRRDINLFVADRTLFMAGRKALIVLLITLILEHVIE